MALNKNQVEEDPINSAIASNKKNKTTTIIVVAVLACIVAFIVLKYKNNFLK